MSWNRGVQIRELPILISPGKLPSSEYVLEWRGPDKGAPYIN